jgi:hypothetical protein
MLKDKSVWDLPVKPDHDGGDDVFTAFIGDRKAVETTEQLMEFVKKWRNVWLFKETKKDIPCHCSEAEEKIIDLTFNPAEILKCFEINKKGKCDTVGCPCAYIMVPTILLRSSILANEFSVPHDIALIQLSVMAGFPPR